MSGTLKAIDGLNSPLFLPSLGREDEESSFDPGSIGGLELWVDGDHVVQDAGIVSELVDQSSSLRSVLSVGDGVAWNENVLNGHSTFSFAGSHQFTVSPNITSASGTIFIVMAANAAASVAYSPFIIAQNYRVVAKTAVGSPWGTFTGANLNGTTILAAGVWALLTMTSTGGGIGTRLRYNAVQEATSANASTGTTPTTIGNEEGFARHLVGDIAAILAYNSVLSAGDITLVEDWLMSPTMYNLP